MVQLCWNPSIQITYFALLSSCTFNFHKSATYLRWDGRIYSLIFCSSSLTATLKELLKSVRICQSYPPTYKSLLFLTHPERHANNCINKFFFVKFNYKMINAKHYKNRLNWLKLSIEYCGRLLSGYNVYTLNRKMNKCMPEVYEWTIAAVDFYPVLFDINYKTSQVK